MFSYIIFPLISRQLLVFHFWRKSLFIYFYRNQYTLISLNNLNVFFSSIGLVNLIIFNALMKHITFFNNKIKLTNFHKITNNFINIIL